MRWFLKCYYGYKNRWDELLFFGVLDWIKNNTTVEHITIEAWDVNRMQTWCQRHKEILDTIGLEYSIIWINWNVIPASEPGSSTDYLDSGSSPEWHNYDLYFFGGWEVVSDQDSYKLPKKPSLKQYLIYIASKRFTRSGWNYYIKYHNYIAAGKHILLWGIGKPYKTTTKILYNILLPKASQIITRDATSYHLAQKYNPKTELYHDFSQYMIDYFRSHKPQKQSIFPPDSYILINTQDHTRSDKTLIDIQRFVDKYPDKKAVYFPCDMQDDGKYFAILQTYIPWLELYDRTKYSVMETLKLFAQSVAWIGSRLHFLYPLHSFGKPYTSTATKDKVAKLLSPTPIDAV